MARIIGGIASSHTPTIGFAFDRNKRDDPAWAPIFEHYAPLQQWIEDRNPDVMIFIFNDHVTSFSSITTPRSRSASATHFRLPTRAAVRATWLRRSAILRSRGTS